MIQAPSATVSIEFYFNQGYKERLQTFLDRSIEGLNQNKFLSSIIKSLEECSF